MKNIKLHYSEIGIFKRIKQIETKNLILIPIVCFLVEFSYFGIL